MLSTLCQTTITASASALGQRRANRESASAKSDSIVARPSVLPPLPDLPPEFLLLIMERLSKTRKFKTLLEFALANRACHAALFPPKKQHGPITFSFRRHRVPHANKELEKARKVIKTAEAPH